MNANYALRHAEIGLKLTEDVEALRRVTDAALKEKRMMPKSLQPTALGATAELRGVCQAGPGLQVVSKRANGLALLVECVNPSFQIRNFRLTIAQFLPVT